jgi:hypothetical protein
VNPKVIVFLAKLIAFWGISHLPASAVKMNPESTRVVWLFHEPLDATKVTCFVGSTKFYKKFILIFLRWSHL